MLRFREWAPVFLLWSASLTEPGAAQQPTSPAATSAAAGLQEATAKAAPCRLAVKARWPDGVPAVGIPLWLYGINAAGGAALIAQGKTDAEGQAVFDYRSGSGPAEVHTANAPAWRVPVVLPRAEVLELVLPEPREVVVVVTADEPAGLENLDFSLRDENRNDHPLVEKKAGRRVWRLLNADAVTLHFSHDWGPFTVVPEDGREATKDRTLVVTPPCELRFRAIRKRSLKLRTRTPRGDAVPYVWVGQDFSPPCRMPPSRMVWTDAEGRVDITEPEEWTLQGTPENASLEIAIRDTRVRSRVSLTRAWPDASETLDVEVELKPDRDMLVVNLEGVPIEGAEVKGEGGSLGRTDSAGKLVVRAIQGSPYEVSAAGFQSSRLEGAFFGFEKCLWVRLAPLPDEPSDPPGTESEPRESPPTGTLSGRVVDEHGRAVPFARITTWDREDEESECNTEADGSFRLPYPNGVPVILSVEAERHARAHRLREQIRDGETIAVTTMREVRVRVVGADGLPVSRFEWRPYRFDSSVMGPPLMCGVGLAREWPVAESDAVIPALRDERAAVVVSVDGHQTLQPVPPGLMETTVTVRPQVEVALGFTGSPPPWKPGIYVHVASSPGGRFDGFRLYAASARYEPYAYLPDVAFDLGNYTLELVETASDGTTRVRSKRTVEITEPADPRDEVIVRLDW